MPKFLEDRLRAEYGNDPHAIYGTMNKIGAMRGNKITAKGREMEAKHERDTMKSHNIKEIRVEVHRDKAGKVTGHTVHHHMMPKPSKSPAFYEENKESYPFGAKGEPAGEGPHMGDHIMQHLGMGDAKKEAAEEVNEENEE